MGIKQVKTIDILKFKAFGDPELKISDIPFRTSLKITRIDYGTGKFVEVPSRGLLSLLSQSPNTPFDKLKNKVLDVGESFKLFDMVFVFNGSEFQVNEKYIEKIYPEISKATAVNPTVPSPPIFITPSATPSVTPALL